MMNGHTIPTPRQDRSRRTLTRILDAASGLLEQKPFDEVTIGDICATARISTGAFYARFPSKTAVLYAIQLRYLEQLEAAIRERGNLAVDAQWTVPDLVREVLAIIARPGVAARATMHSVSSLSTRDVQVMRAITTFTTAVADILFVAIVRIEEPTGRTVLHRDVLFATRACLSTLQQLWLYPERPSDLEMDVEELLDRLMRLFTNFLASTIR